MIPLPQLRGDRLEILAVFPGRQEIAEAPRSNPVARAEHGRFSPRLHAGTPRRSFGSSTVTADVNSESSAESSAVKESAEVIDIRELRKDPRAFLTKLSRKGAEGLVQELLEVDGAWRAATTVSEELRARLKSSGKPTPDQLLQLQRAKEEFQETESKLAELERRRKQLLDRVPNPPADDVPSGGEEDFEVLREVGQKLIGRLCCS